MRLDLDSPVRCSDGDVGELADIVLEPQTRRVTHLVVAPHNRPQDARLVPIAMLRRDDAGPGLALDGTAAEIEALEGVHESEYVRLGETPEPGETWDRGIEQAEALPFLAADYGTTGTAPVDPDPHVVYSYDRVPKGEVEVRRKSTVISADNHAVGHVDGLVIDDAGGQLSHVVLEHGHLWGKREVSIPVDGIDSVRNDEIVLSLTKDQVGALEQVKSQPQGGA
jgi:sporulation protein YlmC with PRC-barrel domain